MIIPKRTKYFVFSRVEPSYSDYNRLIRFARITEAQLVYKTVFSKGNYRLVGFFVLLSPVLQSEMAGLFPNFLVTEMPKGCFDGFQWLDKITGDVDGPIFYDQGGNGNFLDRIRKYL